MPKKQAPEEPPVDFTHLPLFLGVNKEEQIKELQKIKDNSVSIIKIFLNSDPDDVAFYDETLEFIQHLYDTADHQLKLVDGTYANWNK